MLRFSPTIIDGGTGTELERLGVPMHGDCWSGEAVLTHADVLRDIHGQYMDAGAELVIANTFATAMHNMERAGLGDKFELINNRAIELVKEAAEQRENDCLVSGAISTTTFTGPMDYSRLPSGSKAVRQYADQAGVQAEAGGELIILEMMRDVEQTGYALEGALQSGLPIWIGFSCTEEDGVVYLQDSDVPMADALPDIDLEKAHAVGIMHTLVEHTQASVLELRKLWNGKVFNYSHAGRFEMPNWVFLDVMTPELFAKHGRAVLDMGVDCVGGCCGISPAHIAALKGALREK